MVLPYIKESNFRGGEWSLSWIEQNGTTMSFFLGTGSEPVWFWYWGSGTGSKIGTCSGNRAISGWRWFGPISSTESQPQLRIWSICFRNLSQKRTRGGSPHQQSRSTPRKRRSSWSTYWGETGWSPWSRCGIPKPARSPAPSSWQPEQESHWFCGVTDPEHSILFLLKFVITVQTIS